MTNIKRYLQLLRVGALCSILFFPGLHSQAQAQEEESDGNFISNIFGSFKDYWDDSNLEDDPNTYMQLTHKTRPSKRVVEALGGGDYLGVNPATGENCLLTDDKDALDHFSKFSPCWMNNLYSEHFDEELASDYPDDVWSAYDGQPPQAFSLRLKQEGVQEFCNCTNAKKEMMDLSPSKGKDGETISRKSEILNNLARDGMSRIHDKLKGIQKRVAFALTSREMSGYTTDATEDSDGELQIHSKTTLALCMPSEMTKLLRLGEFRSGGDEKRLCGERGVKRLAVGMSKGTEFDCQFSIPERASEHPECEASPMDAMSLEVGHDALAEVTRGLHGIDSYGGGAPSIEDLSQVLSRHRDMAAVPYKEAVRIRGTQYRTLDKAGGDLNFSQIGGARFGGDSISNGEYSKSLIGMFNRSVENEYSQEGKRLWRRNMASIDHALESAISSSGTVSDQAISRVDTKHLQEYLKTNPYLEQRLLVSIESDDPDDLLEEAKLKAAVKSYVEKDLYQAYKHKGASSDYDLASLMGLSYRPAYYEAINECEEIQKTMISLCRAFDQEEGEENLGEFFTNPHLVDLYGDDLKKMQKGEASPGAFKDFGSASYYFCEEAQAEGGVESLNQKQSELDTILAHNKIFNEMERERQELRRLASRDKNEAKKALDEYSNNIKVADEKSGADVSSGDEVSARVYESTSSNDSGQSGKDKQKGSSAQASASQETSHRSFETSAVVGDLEELEKQEQSPEAEQNVDEPEDSEIPSSNTASSDSSQYNRFQESFSYDQSVNSEEDENSDSRGLQERELEEQQRLAEENLTQDQLENLSPVEQSLMSQLESMREREDQMLKQLESLSEKMKEDQKNEELEEKEQEVASLKEDMKELQEELAQVKKDSKDGRQNSAAKSGVDRRNSPSIFGNARVENKPTSRERSSAAVSGAPSAASSAPSSLPPKSRDSSSRRESESKASSGGSVGTGTSSNPGTIGPTLTRGPSQPGARVELPRNVKIAPPDTSLTSLALNTEGNVALRETSSPGVLEKVIFKIENGEIVYKDGHPVIAKREKLNVDEAEEGEALAESTEVPEDEEASRAPASIEKELLEIERELRPRASHQELKEMLQQNLEN